MPARTNTSTKPAVTRNKQENTRLFPDVFPQCNLDVPAFGQYYVYASGPKLAAMDRPKHKVTGKPRGAHDYHSMMWDPRIYRGNTYKSFKKAEDERCRKTALEEKAYKNKDRKAARRDQGQLRTVGGIARPKTPPNHRDNIGLSDMGIQTEKFLEEITDEVKEKEMCTQTDQVYDMDIAPLFCPVKLGVDVATQIFAWELFQFDYEVRPIISSVVGKIIEQALFETMEEAELESLLAQQRMYEDRHRINLIRLQRLKAREQKVTEERTRLIEQRQREVKEEIETEGRVAANLFAASYLSGVATDAMKDLRQDSFSVENESLEESFVPWLHNRSIWQFCKKLASKTLLDDILQRVVEERESQVADGIWREISDQQNTNSQTRAESGVTYFSNTPAYSGYEAETDEE